MGAKTWMLVYADGDAGRILKGNPVLDRNETASFLAKLYPTEKLEPLAEPGDLGFTCPPDYEIVAGCFPGLTILAAKEFGLDYPTKLEPRFLAAAGNRTVYLHAMHSVVDWFAMAVWRNGEVERALSLSPDSGIMENIGPRFAFEEPYWNGQFPVDDPNDPGIDAESRYPFPFHPLELGEAALLNFFGFQYEGRIDDSQVQPEDIPLIRFKRTKLAKPGWKFW